MNNKQSAITPRAEKQLSPEAEKALVWLRGYNGDNYFYSSLRQYLFDHNYLTEKQLACVEKEFKTQSVQLIRPSITPVFSLEVGEVIVLRKAIANRLSRAAGYDRAHRSFDVLEVLAETPKAYRVKVKLSAKKTSRCGVCGLVLETKESLAIGIGPICAKALKIAYGENALSDLELLLFTKFNTVAVEAWIPKSAIAERLNSIESGAHEIPK